MTKMTYPLIFDAKYMLDALPPFSKDMQAVYDSVLALPHQCTDAFRQAKRVKFRPTYKKCKQVIVAGMG